MYYGGWTRQHHLTNVTDPDSELQGEPKLSDYLTIEIFWKPLTVHAKLNVLETAKFMEFILASFCIYNGKGYR